MPWKIHKPKIYVALLCNKIAGSFNYESFKYLLFVRSFCSIQLLGSMAELEEGNEILISDDDVLVGETPAAVTLSSSGLLQWKSTRSSRSLSIEKDVIGYSLHEDSLTITLHCFVKSEEVICFRPRVSSQRIRRDFAIRARDKESFLRWSACIQRFLDQLDRPKKILVFVNPFGGKKNAKKIFNEEVKPFLSIAKVSFTLQVTDYQNHALEIVKALDLSDFDGILCVSGDGILVEVINGLMERSDWKSAIKMPIGIIPAGTGNGIAKSLLDDADEPCLPSHATFAIIKGHKRPLDVATVAQEQKKFYSVLMLTWGLVADIDIESEKYRWMGSSRIDFYLFVRLGWLRRYSGIVYFIPAPGYEEHGEFVNVLENNSTSELSQRAFDLPQTVSNSENGKWKFVNGNFVMVWALNVPWASENVKPAPYAEFSDGLLDLVIVKECSRWALLNLLLKLDSGKHVDSKYVQHLKVQALCLSPGGRVGESTEGGIIDVDGEVVAKGQGAYARNSHDIMAYGPTIELNVEKGLATLFCP